MDFLEAGFIIKDQYEILDLIGRGLNTYVYKARDILIGRELVIKHLPPEKNTEANRKRMERETKVLSHLSHPSIPRIFDFFEEDAGLFQVEELIEGNSLASILEKKGKIDFLHTLDIGIGLLNVLIYLHSQKPPLVHRSILPAHILLDGNNIYLVNFQEVAPPKMRDDFYGVFGYAPPEQYPDGVGALPESDIYTVGVIMHQCITGKDPRLLPLKKAPSFKEEQSLGVPQEFMFLMERVLKENYKERLSSALHFCSSLSYIKSLATESKRCKRCSGVNPASSFFCAFCGEPFYKGGKREVSLHFTDVLPKGKDSQWISMHPYVLMVSRPLGFENLITVNHNKIDEYPHQIRAVKKALHQMGGRCLLADDVGLGKTIEAGIIMEELKARGLVKNILIVVPSHLKYQWQEEMKEKFEENFKVYSSKNKINLEKEDKIIVSYGSVGRRGKVREALLNRAWDLVIVDEAHYVRNRKTLRWSFIDSLKKEYILLLSATPIQNTVLDLFNLISLLKPGLSIYSEFRSKFYDSKHPRRPKNIQNLKKLLSEVMVRTRRADALIKFPRRIASTKLLELAPEEMDLYLETVNFVRALAQKSYRKTPFLMRDLLQKITSSPEASYHVLLNLSQSQIYDDEERKKWLALSEMAKNIYEPAKILEVVKIIKAAGDRIVIFTSHRRSQDYIVEYLRNTGIDVWLYRGKSDEKKEALNNFRKKGMVMVVSQRGGEGLNLQDTCNILVNYDLPWNPMVLEQRIGRLQRLGQRRDVYVFNLVGKNTIENYIMELLEEKIKMFHLAVGQLDLILGIRFEEEDSFENSIWKKILSSSDESNLRLKILSLGDELTDSISNISKIEESKEVIDHLAV